MRTRVGRNDEVDSKSGVPTLSVLNHPGDLGGRKQTKWLTYRELDSAHLHVLLNCDELDEIR
ncbi:hypothetical protein PIB30_115572, partial [Stylosanthes scabra]|nr:hypothetical protein [Stylosanthes scabra]